MDFQTAMPEKNPEGNAINNRGYTRCILFSRRILIESKRNLRDYNKIEEEVMKKADTEGLKIKRSKCFQETFK